MAEVWTLFVYTKITKFSRIVSCMAGKEYITVAGVESQGEIIISDSLVRHVPVVAYHRCYFPRMDYLLCRICFISNKTCVFAYIHFDYSGDVNKLRPN